MSFAHRVIAITGAASGIGLATAHLLASHSATLSIADINATALSHAETSLRRQHPAVQILSYILDVRSEEQVAKWIETTLAAFGRLDGAANLAGVIGKSIGLAGVQDLEMEEWEFVLGVNLRGVALCLKYQLRAMGGGKEERGSVVNASSVAGVMGMANNAVYTASKHGVIGLTRSAAKEVGARGIRVNAICPGFIDTPMQHQSTQTMKDAGVDDEARKEKRIKNVALGRGGKAEECADLIVYLLGDGASFMTGNAISIDGGWNC